jgi:hypothetical protein
MTFKTFLRTGSAAAIAAVLAIGVVPAAASAQDRGSEHTREDRGGDHASTEARQARQQARAQRAPQQQQQRVYQAPQQQQQRAYQSPVAQERSGRDWNRGDRRSETGATRSTRDWNQSGQAQARAQAQAQVQAQAQAQAATRDRSSRWGGRGQVAGTVRSTAGDWQRNRTYSDTTRNQSYRDQNYRGTQYRQQQTQNAYRSGYRDSNRDDRRSWNHDWRRDNRYNWYSYRNSNRNVFHLGSYYSPYRNYSYSRVNIGFRLGSLFFGSRYWINDPWQYRLPEAYGGYRWIRYYDDALLVDTYSGEVVDVIYDFFW